MFVSDILDEGVSLLCEVVQGGWAWVVDGWRCLQGGGVGKEWSSFVVGEWDVGRAGLGTSGACSSLRSGLYAAFGVWEGGGL